MLGLFSTLVFVFVFVTIGQKTSSSFKAIIHMRGLVWSLDDLKGFWCDLDFWRGRTGERTNKGNGRGPCGPKNTNTAYDKVQERPNMWFIVEKRIVRGYRKLYFHVSNTQIQKYKYTNTAFDKVPERPNMWYIFEKRIVQGNQKLYTGPSVSCFGIFLCGCLPLINQWMKRVYLYIC